MKIEQYKCDRCGELVSCEGVLTLTDIGVQVGNSGVITLKVSGDYCGQLCVNKQFSAALGDAVNYGKKIHIVESEEIEA